VSATSWGELRGFVRHKLLVVLHDVVSLSWPPLAAACTRVARMPSDSSAISSPSPRWPAPGRDARP
jgi:hypothetical protein